MRVHYQASYISWNADVPQRDWSQDFWDARKYIRAVKSARINGYCHVPQGFFRKRIDETNIAYARQYFGSWALRAAATLAGQRAYAFVPVPSKDCIVNAEGPFRHAAMLNAAFGNDVLVSDILRFTEVIPKASEGGPRSFEYLFPRTKFVGRPPRRPVVLVDDVVTGGGHMRACKRRLELEGCEVLGGIACGHTCWNTDEDPWVANYFET